MDRNSGTFKGVISANSVPDTSGLRIDHLDRPGDEAVALVTFTWGPVPGHDGAPAGV
ncbi:hypothetical protein ABZT27_07045 [Streptomyces sp. NPDC005389]|uniref:hypothetical protein n=1 Tax=unclassified Streptomyces TaxID=2593676 RepID=UPI0033B5B446